jgi:[lysine-biosynthesis-protein LysW]--L-2-aminoadipate ligase
VKIGANRIKVSTSRCSSASLVILYDTIRWEEKSLYEAAKRKGVKECHLLDCKDLVIDLNQQDPFFAEKNVVQRTVSYFKSLHSTAALEGMGVDIINPLNAAIICGNKLFCHAVLHGANIKTPKAVTAFSEKSALQGLEKLGYPAVIKPAIGSWGRLIALLKDKDAAKAVIEDRQHMFPLYQVYYFEEFVHRPPRDIRAIVVGGSIAAAIYRYSGDNEWKTNMALGGRAETCPITKELEDICIKASKAVGGRVVGVDLMENERDGLVIHEVNNTTEFKNTVKVTGKDIPGMIVEYACQQEGHL